VRLNVLIGTALLYALAFCLMGSANADPIEDRSIVAFTSEPNDLGTAKDFFRKFPNSRCQQDLLDEDHLLYFCAGTNSIQKFYFVLSYDEHTLVLSGVSLHGEEPNLDKTLIELMGILDGGQ
jgi:hypothetical protein